MQIEPPESAFAERYGRGQPQVVWCTLVADLETPVSAFLKLGTGKPMSFLLESVEGGAVRGRHSIIGIEPDLIWRTNNAKAEINRSARAKPDQFAPCPEPPLAALRALIKESRIELPDTLPPMAAGVFGYLGYDMVRLMEDLPAPNPDPMGIPDAVLVRPTIIVVFDAVKDSITVVTPVRPEKGVDAKTAMARAVERLSGAPKVRAMQIIVELEKEKRGLYAGCVGYFSAAGEMDTCIVLRTALVKDGKMYVQAGAGIVADSNPDSEQQECVNKAKALFRAAEEARRFASAAKRGQ